MRAHAEGRIRFNRKIDGEGRGRDGGRRLVSLGSASRTREASMYIYEEGNGAGGSRRVEEDAGLS